MQPAISEMELAHTLSVEEVLQRFKVVEEDGLTPARVVQLREQYGANGEPTGGSSRVLWYRYLTGCV